MLLGGVSDSRDPRICLLRCCAKGCTDNDVSGMVPRRGRNFRGIRSNRAARIRSVSTSRCIHKEGKFKVRRNMPEVTRIARLLQTSPYLISPIVGYLTYMLAFSEYGGVGIGGSIMIASWTIMLVSVLVDNALAFTSEGVRPYYRAFIGVQPTVVFRE
jgi:hypothetical protein